jgi:hypothetical protein
VLAHLGVAREPGWGLPPQGSDNMEDTIGCYVVGLVDAECLLGLVFVLVGVSLRRHRSLTTAHMLDPLS